MPVLSAASGPENTPSPAPLGPEAARLREHVRARLEALPSIRLASAEAVYQIDIDGPGGGSLLIAIQGGRAEVTTGASSQAKVCLTLAAATLERLLDGKLNATVAYMTKKLKIRGDIAAAMKLEGLLK
jgi:putative sterol carrier protein